MEKIIREKERKNLDIKKDKGKEKSRRIKTIKGKK